MMKELVLLNFNLTVIIGGEYKTFPAKNYYKYKCLLGDYLMKLYLESHDCIKDIFATSYSLSKNNSKSFYEAAFDVHFMYHYRPHIIPSDLFANLMQFNNVFYFIAHNADSLVQSNFELYNYNENSNNSFVKTFKLLMNIFIQELEICIKNLKIVYIICLIIFFVIFVGIFILLYFSFLSANKRRLNYIEIFYGINDNIIKTTIINCHKSIHKLEKNEFYKLDEKDEDNLSDDISEKVNFKINDKNDNELLNNSNKKSNYLTENNVYLKVLGLFMLIIFSFFILNYVFLIKFSKESISMHTFLTTLLNYHSKITDIFNGYRQYAYDELSYGSEGRIILDLLEEHIYISYDTISSDREFIQSYINSYMTMNEELTKLFNRSLCSYYITDYFNSEEECIEKYKNFINHDFSIFVSYFIQEIRILKNLVIDILTTKPQIYYGKLNEFRVDLWMADENIPKVFWKTNGTKFRADIFNNDTLHNNLNNIYINIIIPYVDANRKAILNNLSLKVTDIYFILFSFADLLILFIIFYVYWTPLIFFFNNIIYKTKNMLSIIPTNILIHKSNIEILKDLSKN